MLREHDIDKLLVGDWYFFGVTGPDGVRVEDAYIAIRIHEGDNGIAILPIDKGGNLRDGAWIWNGSRDVPSLTPSILHWGDGKNNVPTWHGFLRDGKLVAV